jgi:hypothetical protein
VTNTRSIARCIFAPAGFLLAWSTHLPARPVRQADEKCDSGIRLDDRIISPLIGIADLRHGMRGERTVASYCYTHSDVVRREACKDGPICTLR